MCFRLRGTAGITTRIIWIFLLCFCGMISQPKRVFMQSHSTPSDIHPYLPQVQTEVGTARRA